MAVAVNSMHVEIGPLAAFQRWSDPAHLLTFLDGVTAIASAGSHRQHWSAEIDGQVEELDVDVEVVAGRSITWRGTDGRHTREVSFSDGDDGDGGTVVSERFMYEPTGITVGALELGVVARTVSNDLWRFKVLVEEGQQALDDQSAVARPLEGPWSDYVPDVHLVSVNDLPSQIAGTALDRSGRGTDQRQLADIDESAPQASRPTAADNRRAYDWKQ